MIQPIEEKFEWLVDMDYQEALNLIAKHHEPYYLYAYYIDGKNYFKTSNMDSHRIHVRVDNGVIVLVNGVG